jgi:copper chaperone
MITTSPTPTRHYSVRGMTCQHCVTSVGEEVSEITGVTGVEVDLASGELAVSGAGFSDEDVAAAVAEAGYEVAR